MTIDEATEADLPAILALINQAIAETTAVWHLQPETLETRGAWFAARRAAGLPVLVARRGDTVLGFASYGPFRPFAGYDATVEHSVYVDPAAHRQGIGAALLAALEAQARAQGRHVMVGAVEAGNAGSIALHLRAGFVETGRMPEVGRKFGRWLDLVLLQKRLGG
ncbi:GNAT family N-acetyltransferase [Falsiroseomonas tokyonensis]|uniref:GNAT family N-acetyltransferase n=1 Tax=Falsiroseomonas tokyonensis TaxID=430521 RepID=A0ABV7BS68_9PROT|nr:GNAT family N-acetyltransferase [Falsiroseomonas tokyonensis]MBU8537270.1 N-acetyltransferase [Falsiroseomonas tokyonensis]